MSACSTDSTLTYAVLTPEGRLLASKRRHHA